MSVLLPWSVSQPSASANSIQPPTFPLDDLWKGDYPLPKPLMADQSRDLLPGTLDLLILSTLESGPAHGYTIMDSIWSRSGELFRVEEGALYPALHRLQLKGLLAADWGTSEANRRAKFYRLTVAGKKHLARERADWQRIVLGMSRVVEGI